MLSVLIIQIILLSFTNSYVTYIISFSHHNILLSWSLSSQLMNEKNQEEQDLKGKGKVKGKGKFEPRLI